MSSVSQTPARKPMSFGVRFGIAMAAVVGIVGLSLGGAWKGVAALALSARPHWPDVALFMGLSPAIKVHLVAAVAALLLGGVLMTARKGRTFHRVAGWVWVVLVLLTAGATLFITSLNHGRWSLLHLFTGWVLIVLPLAVMWAKRREVQRHRRTMMGLFYGGFAINLFIAFIPGRTLWTMFLG
ncbi:MULTISPECIES: DUF2306 domain-containing protein [unclassified Phenylobacterium]|uniref:DUF2306 domain-containing protein n=1 Tax=unclassified Phenylobacterium TaxID=2640670 RepID=UPI000A8F4A3F|nr:MULTISPECIES: DUF2306 domain-containing protein [unclassified Phenylobacterium]